MSNPPIMDQQKKLKIIVQPASTVDPETPPDSRYLDLSLNPRIDMFRKNAHQSNVSGWQPDESKQY